jgi:hypothetical protein
MFSRQHFLLLAAFAAATPGIASDKPLLFSGPDPMEIAQLDRVVGQISGKCCLPGRRWGCDPANFNQTNCVPLSEQYPSCFGTSIRTMKCTDATCVTAGPEDVCKLVGKSIAMNRCRPTGRITTVGCPADHWQCHVISYPYTMPTAPVRDGFVCEFGNSTICAYNWSRCD